MRGALLSVARKPESFALDLLLASERRLGSLAIALMSKTDEMF